MCLHKNFGYIGNLNILAKHLAVGGIHMKPNCTIQLAQNIIAFLRKLDSYVFCDSQIIQVCKFEQLCLTEVFICSFAATSSHKVDTPLLEKALTLIKVRLLA